jgi:hypothetical protein
MLVREARLDHALVIVARGPAQRNGVGRFLGPLRSRIGLRLFARSVTLVQRILLLVQQLALRLREISRTLQ